MFRIAPKCLQYGTFSPRVLYCNWRVVGTVSCSASQLSRKICQIILSYIYFRSQLFFNMTTTTTNEIRKVFFVFTIKKRFNYVSCYLFSILISNHLLQFQHFVFMSIFAYIFFFVLPSISFSFRRSRFLFSSILLFLRSYSSMLKFPRLYNRIRSKSRFKKMMPTKA